MEVAPPTYRVVLRAPGPNRLKVMQTLRSLRPELGLEAVKSLLERPPQVVLWSVGHYELEQVKRRLEMTGGVFEFRRAG